MAAKEVLSEGPCVAKTLQCAVHEASIAQVVQANDSPFGPFLHLKVHVLELFLVKLVFVLTVVLVISFVLLPAPD